MGHFDRLPFSAVWAVDFEFTAPPGERPEPVCLADRELRSNRNILRLASMSEVSLADRELRSNRNLGGFLP